MSHPPSSQHRRRSKRPLVAILTAVALAVGGQLSAVVGATAAVAATPTTAASNAPASHACPKLSATRHLTCFALKRTDKKPLSQKARPLSIPSGYGYGPSQLQAAYNLASAAASNGGNSTVAVVDAYDDANAASDLAAYRSAAGLPAATFSKVNQNGQASPLPSAPPAGDDWTVEEALDLDMVSAICPKCKIVLVEANDDTSDGLYIAENTAASLAGYISNSWGGSESSTDTSMDSQYFNHPGVVMTASSGDSGYGVIYPASSSNVVAVGGTSLSSASNARGWSETVWGSSAGGNGAGSGCSAYDPKPSWQKDSGCSNRTVADVAADADPATGVAVYDTSNGNGGWTEVGGTSASSPMIAATYALAANAGSTPAQDLYQHTGNLYDVTSGANGSCSPAYLCTGEVGYDGPTGNGTPNGLTAFGGTSTGNTVTVTNPGNQTGTVGTAASLQIKATDSASGQTLTYSAGSTLPAGLSINSSTGLISGTPTTAGTYNVTVTATDTTGAKGSTSFTWTINPAGGGCTSTGNKVANGGFESGTASWTTTPNVIGQWSPSEPPHGGSYDAWFDGYGTSHTDTASQSVKIPAGCSATLSFWLHIDSDQTGSTNGSFTVKVGSTTVATFSNLNANSGYTQHTYSLGSSLAGQTVTLLFTGTETNSLQTSYVLDDVSLTAS